MKVYRVITRVLGPVLLGVKEYRVQTLLPISCVGRWDSQFWKPFYLWWYRSSKSYVLCALCSSTLVEQRVGGQETDGGATGGEALGTFMVRDVRLGEGREPAEGGEVTGKIISKE